MRVPSSHRSLTLILFNLGVDDEVPTPRGVSTTRASALAHPRLDVDDSTRLALLFSSIIYIQIHAHLKWGGYE
jgi:hypothetical protein